MSNQKSDIGQRPPGGNQNNSQAVDISKLLEQRQQQQRQASVSPTSPSMQRANVPYGVPGMGNQVSPMQAGVVRQGVNQAANALLMQRMMHPGLTQTPPRGKLLLTHLQF